MLPLIEPRTTSPLIVIDGGIPVGVDVGVVESVAVEVGVRVAVEVPVVVAVGVEVAVDVRVWVAVAVLMAVADAVAVAVGVRDGMKVKVGEKLGVAVLLVVVEQEEQGSHPVLRNRLAAASNRQTASPAHREIILGLLTLVKAPLRVYSQNVRHVQTKVGALCLAPQLG